MIRRTLRRTRHALRRQGVGTLIDTSLRSLSRAGKLHPAARSLHAGVQITRNVPYLGSGIAAHTLDVYRPSGPHDGPRPVLIYVHGGGFRILSKDSHWMMALKFARQGYVVFSINYRLAPAHPFPAAVHDTFDAVQWIVAHAGEYGGDPGNLTLAGESAGANLVCGVVAAHCYALDDKRARALHALDLGIRAALPACGLLQVSDADRFTRRRPDLPAWLDDRIQEVCTAYYRGEGHPLADPLVLFETREPLRPLPPMVAICGTRDPILDDTRRLAAAVVARGGRCHLSIHPGGVHAFHAVFWREPAISAWQAQLDFLDDVRAGRGSSARPAPAALQ